MKAELIDIPTFSDYRGSVSVLENLPFDVKRVFYIYDVQVMRGQHALRTCYQILVAVTGQLQVDVGNQRYLLDSPSKGLYIAPLMWRELTDWAEGTVCLVLASETYDEDNYIRSYDEFKRLRLQRRGIE